MICRRSCHVSWFLSNNNTFVGYADNFVNNGFSLAYELIAKRLVKNGEFVKGLIHGFVLPFDKFLTENGYDCLIATQ
ncbi:MAG TPA: hypothetical protein DCM71_24260 [Runella sp.]|nr:hypothetical protein [Runella sp.]